jgi:PAS domain S-box-containing protein
MLENEDFRRVFMAMPMPSLLLRADSPVFTIIDVNEAYLQATGSKASDLLYKGVFEAFPDNPDLEDANGVSNLRTSLDLVVRTGSDHKMPIQRYDIPIRGKNEFELRYWLPHNVPVLDKVGKTYCIIHSVADVTAEIVNQDKNIIAERDLHKAKDLLLQAEDITHIGSWELDLSNNELYWSEGVFRICGYEPGEIQVDFTTGLGVIHPDDQEMAVQAMQRTIEQGNPYEIIKRFVRKDGSIRIINSRGKIILNEKGEKVKLVGVFQDITDDLEKDKALSDSKFELERSNERYEYVLKATFDAVWDWNIASGNLYRSKNFELIFGHRFNEYETDLSSWYQFIHPEDQDRVLKSLQHCLDEDANHWEAEYRYQRSDRRYAYVHDRGIIIRDQHGKASRMVGAMHDVSLQKKQEAESHFALKLNAIFSADDSLEICLSKVNQALCDYANIPVVESWVTSFDQKELLLMSQDAIRTELKGRSSILKFSVGQGLPGAVFKEQKEIYIPDIIQSDLFVRKEFAKQNHLISARGIPVFFKNGIVAVFICYYDSQMYEDVSWYLTPNLLTHLGVEVQRKKTETELRHFFDLSPDLLSVSGTDGYFKKVNRAFTKLLGYSEQEILSIPILDLIDPDDQDMVQSFFSQRQEGKVQYFEARCVTKDGKHNWLAWTMLSVPGEGLVYGIAKDIDQKRKDEEALRRYNAQITNILETISEGFFTIDADWNVQYWNRMAEQMLGVKREDMLGHSLWEKFAPAQKTASFINYKKTLEERVAVHFEDYFEPTGQWFEAHSYPAENGMATVFFREITERKKAQRALEDAYQEKHMILESIGDGFFAVDKEWKVHYWNQSAERILGLSRTEVLGKHIYSIYPEQQYATFYTNCVIAERDQVTMHFEEYVEPLSIWIDVSVYPSPSGLLVYFRDVTERKEIQKQFESVVNNMPGITYRCLLDDKWSMLFISNGVEAITGYPAADFVIHKKRIFSSIIHPDDLNATFNITEALSKGEVFSIQYRIICADGAVKWVEDKGRGVYNNSHQLMYIDGVIMDVTEQKQYQETLLRLNEELNKRAHDLAISNAELEQFAYVASHDLQEPLRMITGFLSQLEKKYKHELDDTARQYIGFATDGAKRMRTVILDLLEYSRVGSADYEKELVNIHQVIAEILEMNRNDLIRREARVFFDGMPLIKAARTPISQLFQNLITNALKYQSPDQRPEIKITATEYPLYWQFAVADNGIGIEKEYFEKIFVIFQRLHHRNEYSGTGIGLSICKKIVEMHNGKIWVESLPGRGSTFFFTIEK